MPEIKYFASFADEENLQAEIGEGAHASGSVEGSNTGKQNNEPKR